MKLLIKERLVLFNILPKEGDFTTLKALRKLKEELSISDQEKAELNFSAENTLQGVTFNWDNSKDTGKEIEIKGTLLTTIIETLSGLNKQKKLTEDFMTVYEKFIGEDGK